MSSRERLSKAREIFRDRWQWVQRLQEGGRKVVGYLCIYTPVEVITAFDLVPFRIFGSLKEGTTEADNLVPRTFCPFIRSVLSLSALGRYHFVDGLILVHTCDAMERTSRAWESVAAFPYIHFMDMPTKTGKRHQEALKLGIEDLVSSLEAYTGKNLSPDKLRKAVRSHNEQKKLVREIYELTKSVPPLISGKEIMEILGAINCLLVEEGNKMLREIIQEVRQKVGIPNGKSPRILIWGSILDDPTLTEILEAAGASVVIDDTCTGTRGYWQDVEEKEDLLDGLAKHYLVDLKCPRTFRVAPHEEGRKDYASDLESRFGYLRDFIREWKVDGALLQSVKYCDCHGFEVPQVKDYLDSLGIPSLYLEHDYTEGGLRALATRVAAFVEMLDRELE